MRPLILTLLLALMGCAAGYMPPLVQARAMRDLGCIEVHTLVFPVRSNMLDEYCPDWQCVMRARRGVAFYAKCERQRINIGPHPTQALYVVLEGEIVRRLR